MKLFRRKREFFYHAIVQPRNVGNVTLAEASGPLDWHGYVGLPAAETFRFIQNHVKEKLKKDKDFRKHAKDMGHNPDDIVIIVKQFNRL